MGQLHFRKGCCTGTLCAAQVLWVLQHWESLGLEHAVWTCSAVAKGEIQQASWGLATVVTPRRT